MSGERTLQWYAVMCGGSAGVHESWRVVPEFKAVARMDGEGYEAFCPTVSQLYRPSRGERLREMRAVPLWDGYVFARLDDRALSQRMQRWPEVFDVIRHCGQPRPLEDRTIAALRELEEVFRFTAIRGHPADFIRKILTGRILAAHKQAFQVGDVVEHRGAAFERLRGRISAIDRDNIQIVVDLLFGSTRTIKAKTADVALVPA